MTLDYEVTPEQTLKGLWETTLKYHELHGASDVGLEIEGAYYEFQEHLKNYAAYKEKSNQLDEMKKKYEENLKYIRSLTENDSNEDNLNGTVFHEMIMGASVINFFKEEST